MRIWPGWNIARELGIGSYGKVYEIHRKNGEWTEKAAMKVIRIPSSPIELEQLRSEGITGESTKEYLARCVQDIQKEIGLMQHFMGCSNIVSYEDYMIRSQETGIGWDILIRMELLTPLSQVLAQRQLSEQEILRLGMDIAQALAICHSDGVIHRDVKPQNIFLNDLGNYKLGDFGISRAIPRTGDVLSFKGTVPYMAPETFAMRGTDARSDIYSLALVLYRCLNRGREPFLVSTGFTPRDQEYARMRRLRGEPLPPPERGSRELQRVLAKALDPDPDRRYQTAGAFRQALWEVANGRRSHYSAESGHKTPDFISVLKYGSGNMKRTLTGINWRKVLIAACVISAAALIVSGIYLVIVTRNMQEEFEETSAAHSISTENSSGDSIESGNAGHAGEDDDIPAAESETENVLEASSEESAEDGNTENNVTEEEEVVVFNDPALERAVKEQMSIGDRPVTKSEALAQTRLDFSEQNKAEKDMITDLTGLSAFSNLEELLLSHNRIDNLDELQEMNSLKKLKLDFNNIGSLDPLQNLTSLEFLDLENNQVSSLSPILSLTKINMLDVRANQISDLRGISSMEGLKELLLGRNQIQDITPVVGLENLQTLGFGHNQVRDISALSSLKSLRKLTMGDNQIEYIEAVLSLPELNYLEVYENPLKDEELLEQLTDVKVVTEQDEPDA